MCISEDEHSTIQPITEHTGGIHGNTQYAPSESALPQYDISIQLRCAHILFFLYSIKFTVLKSIRCSIGDVLISNIFQIMA